jgi:excisionase family DNA binding protein
MDISMIDQLYTASDVAKKLNVSRNAVYYWIQQGRLEAIRVGSLWRITPRAVREFIECRESPPLTRRDLKALSRAAGDPDRHNLRPKKKGAKR